MLSLYPKMGRDLPKHRCGLSIGPDKRVAWLPRGAPLTVCRETSAPRILDFGQYTTIRVVYANSNTVLKRTILAFILAKAREPSPSMKPAKYSSGIKANCMRSQDPSKLRPGMGESATPADPLPHPFEL